MPRMTIRIEPMNAIKGEQPNEHQPLEQFNEPLPERRNCANISDEMLANTVEEVKHDVQPVSKSKRTRRPKAKHEEEPAVVINIEPGPIHETAPSFQF